MIVKAAGLLGGQTVAAESGVWDVMPPTRLRECLSSSMRTLRPIVSGSMVLHPFLGGIDGWYDVEVCILAQCILISHKPARPLSFTRPYHILLNMRRQMI